MPELSRVRSMLFVPGTRADMIAKIPRFAPDVAIVDLEDAVAPADKAAARRTAAAAIDALDPDGPSTVLVRVNPVGTPWFAADVAAAAGSAAAGVVVPKLATRPQLGEVTRALAEHSWAVALIIAGIETALGVADARSLLADGREGPGAPGSLSGAYFGAEDYIADIGGRRSAGGDEVLYARSQVCLAAYLAGVPAIDQVVVDIADDNQFLADARRGQSLGYQGKMCIHPRQVGLAHQVFTPAPEELAHARAVVAAGEAGVAVVDGQMVDDVHVRMARAVLARAPGTRIPGTRTPGTRTPGTPGPAAAP
jgi:citrate lyase subunit beta/citryl-CoA lyase